MASKMDVYAPCPCGSGKKVKFCCQAVLGEMDKVARLHENKQPDQALKTLERLEEKHPDAPIVSITRAQLLMEEERFDEAASTMRNFLKENPNNAHGSGLLAFSRFMDVGFQQAKPEIHRAFQVCFQNSPEIVASLAAQIADELYQTSTPAAREHLGLALRLTKDGEERQALFQQLMRIDGSSEIPFPLRGTHHLVEIDGPEELQKDIRTAFRLSTLGCWQISATLFEKVADQLSDNWCVWKNIGLCRAWDADHDGAAEALHKAAELASEYEVAVECETLAQLLELPQVEDQVEIMAARFRIGSASMALSLLDGVDRLERISEPADQEKANPKVVGRYLALDMPAPDNSVEVTDDNVPTVQSEVSVFEFQTPEGPQSVLSVIAAADEGRDSAIQLVQNTLGDEIKKPEPGETEEGRLYADSPVRMMLKELQGSQERKYYGTRLDIQQRRDIARADAERFINETWLNTPLKRLGDVTPLAAAEDEELKIDVAAAVRVLESISDVAMIYGDLGALRKTLKVEPEKPLPVTEDLSLNSLSVLESHRLPVAELSDEQLSHIVNRVLLIRHLPFTYEVLTEVSKRDLDALQVMDRPGFLRTIAQVCRDLGKREEALKWLQEGRQEVEKGDNFEEKLNWAMREFQFRIEDRNDPELPGLVSHLWEYYGTKLPAIREAMEPILKEFGMPIPGESASGIILPGSEAATAGAAAGGESKLWVPGDGGG